MFWTTLRRFLYQSNTPLPALRRIFSLHLPRTHVTRYTSFWSWASIASKALVKCALRPPSAYSVHLLIKQPQFQVYLFSFPKIPVFLSQLRIFNISKRLFISTIPFVKISQNNVKQGKFSLRTLSWRPNKSPSLIGVKVLFIRLLYNITMF